MRTVQEAILIISGSAYRYMTVPFNEELVQKYKFKQATRSEHTDVYVPAHQPDSWHHVPERHLLTCSMKAQDVSFPGLSLTWSKGGSCPGPSFCCGAQSSCLRCPQIGVPMMAWQSAPGTWEATLYSPASREGVRPGYSPDAVTPLHAACVLEREQLQQKLNGSLSTDL